MPDNVMGVDSYNQHDDVTFFATGGHKAQPHAAMLHACDGLFQSYCHARKMHAMCCNAFSNMLECLLPILEYLQYYLSDFETVYSIAMVIS